ncbi:MAG: hypothetical protein NVS3B7_16870 [Candidatus Elarobacter sp.]
MGAGCRSPGRSTVRGQRRGRMFNAATKAFVWVVLVIFILTSVGVALVAVH